MSPDLDEAEDRVGQSWARAERVWLIVERRSHGSADEVVYWLAVALDDTTHQRCINESNLFVESFGWRRVS